jgi:long-chain acyl-CoA synthetase
MLTGSAPTPVSLLDFFNGMGIELYEAYGCSESIIPVAMNRPTQNKHGSVGQPLPYHEVVISDSGEVLVKGPGVFKGYLDSKDADNKITPEGFLSTGDVGYIDRDGYLFLTGRKTDMIKTSTGRRIFPQKIESLLKKHALVEHAILVGNGRKHLAAIVTVSDTSTSEVEIENLNRIIQESNGELADYERLKAILVVQSGFSVERGHITLNQKIRRGFIEQCYKQQLDNLYGKVGNSNLRNDRPLIEVV